VSTYSQNWTPANFGTEENKVIHSLSEGVTYWFAIKAVDDSSNQASWTSSGTVSWVNTANWAYAKADNNLLPSSYGRWHYGFEGITDDVMWEEKGTASYIQSGGTYHNGSNACEFLNLTTAYTGREIWSSTCSVTEGDDYTAGIWAYVPATAGAIGDIQFEIEIRWYDASGTFLSADTSAGITLSAFDSWEKITLSSVTAPTNATQARLAISAKETVDNNADPLLDDAEFYKVVTPPSDTTAPSAISNLTALAEGSNLGGRVKLKWTAPGDDGITGDNSAGQYLVKYSTKYIGPDDFYASWVSTWGYFTPSSTPGTEELKVLTGFNEGTTYFFAIRTKDDAGNWSIWPGTSTNVNSLSFSVPTDSAPAKITDLSGATGSSGGEIVLTWTAPGDDGTTGDISGGIFRIKYSSEPADTWDTMPYSKQISTSVSYGTSCSVTITGLLNETTYYFYIKTGDEKPNWSALSNKTTSYTLDTVAPAAISNLTALTGSDDGEVKLQWTAPGDDGITGDVSGGLYRIKAATYNITASNFDSVSNNGYYSFSVDISTSYTTQGTEHTYTMTGLYAGTTYYFAIKLRDESNNWGTWSDVANSSRTAPAQDLAPKIILNLSGEASQGQILLTWTEPSGEPDLDFYRFYRDSTTPYDFADAYTFDVDTGNVSYADTGLEAGVTYYYRAETFDYGSGADGLYSVVFSSAYSNVVSTCVPHVPTYSISGQVTVDGSPKQGLVVMVGGRQSATDITDASGNYSISGLVEGDYIVRIATANYYFTPSSRTFTPLNSDQTGQDFSGTWHFGNRFVVENAAISDYIDDATDKISIRFTAKSSKTMNEFRFYGSRSGTPQSTDYSFKLYADNNGLPSSTSISSTTVSFTTTGSGLWHIVTFPNTNLTAGSDYHMVIQATGTPSITLAITRTDPWMGFFPLDTSADEAANFLDYNITTANDWTFQNKQPVYLIGFTDGAYEGNPYSATSTGDAYSVAGDTWTGVRFRVTADTICITGIVFCMKKRGTPADDCYYELRGPDGFSNFIESGTFVTAAAAPTVDTRVQKTLSQRRIIAKDRDYWLVLKSPGSTRSGGTNDYLLNIQNTSSGSEAQDNLYNQCSYLSDDEAIFVNSQDGGNTVGTSLQRDVSFCLERTAQYPPYAPTNLSQEANGVTLPFGEWTNDSTPELFFTQDDYDSSQLKFHLEISSYADFSYIKISTVSPLIAKGNASYIVSSALPEATYYWRVWSEDSDGYTGSTTTANNGGIAFKVDLTAPTGLSNTSPADNSFNLETSTFLVCSTASDSLSGGVEYYFEISTTSSFNGSDDKNSGWQSETIYSPTLSDSTTYYWHVKARDAVGNETSFTGTWKFSTKVPPPAPEAVMVYYSSSTVAADRQYPSYRDWNGTNWGSEYSALGVTSTASGWYVLKQCPSSIRDEWILGIRDAAGHINVQVFDGSSWGNIKELATYGSYLDRRTFDIAYEQISGNAVVVYKGAETDVVYWICWNGSSWSNSYAINLSTHGAGTINWIRLAPKPNSNQILLGIQDSSSDISFHVLSGSTPVSNSGIVVEWATESASAYCFDIAWEQQSGDGMVVWAGPDEYNFYRIWNGSVWSSSSTVDMGSLSISVSNGFWIRLVADPNSDKILMGTVESTTLDLDVAVWDGSAWGNQVELFGSLPDDDGQYYDLAWERNSGEGIAVYTINAGTAAYRTFTSGSWSAQALATETGDGALIRWIRLAADDDSTSDNIMLIHSDTNNDINVQMWNGSSWGTITEVEDNSSLYYQCFDIAFPLAIPPTPDTTPPSAISNLTALTGNDDGEVKLKWTAPGDDGMTGDVSGGLYRIKAATYNITASNFDSVSDNGYYTFSVDISTSYTTQGTEHTYTMTGLYAGTTYYFAIKLRDDSNNWATWSDVANSSRTAPAQDLTPPTPTGFSVSPGASKITLFWTEPTGEPDLDYYKIYRDSSSPYDFGDAYTITVETGNSSYVDTGLSEDVTYYYKMSVIDLGDSGDGLFSYAYESAFTTTLSTTPLSEMPTPEAFLVYFATSTNQILRETPRCASWNGTSWASGYDVKRITQTASGWYVLKKCPTANKWLFGIQDSAKNLNVMIYDETTNEWSAPKKLTTNISYTGSRGFDIEFEQQSGKAVVVYKDADSKIPQVINWTESSGWGTSFSANISTNGAGTIAWIELVPKPNSDNMILLIGDSYKDLTAHIWYSTATNFGSSVFITPELEVYGQECFDAVFEMQSGDGMVAWSPSAGDIKYRIWDGTSWSAEQDGPQGIGAQIYWVRLAADPQSDAIVLGTLDGTSAPYDINVSTWDGSLWGATTEVEISASVYTTRCFDVAWETTSGEAIVVFNDGTSVPKARKYSGGSWDTVDTSASDVGGAPCCVQLRSDNNSDDIILITSNDTATPDIYAQKWDGSLHIHITLQLHILMFCPGILLHLLLLHLFLPRLEMRLVRLI